MMCAPAGPSRVCGCGVLGRSPAQGRASGAAARVAVWLGRRCGSDGGAACRARRSGGGLSLVASSAPITHAACVNSAHDRASFACRAGGLRRIEVRRRWMRLSCGQLAQNRGLWMPDSSTAPDSVHCDFAKQSSLSQIPRSQSFAPIAAIFPSSIAPNLVQMRAIFLRGSC